jgi:hypothetical protein
VATVLRRSPPGTTVAQARGIVSSIHQSFVHAIHAGIVVAIAFMVLAAVVSAVYVRSHVEPEAMDAGGPLGH